MKIFNAIFITVFALAAAAFSQSLEWQRTTGPNGVCIGDIVSTSPDSVLVSSGQGIFLSTDNGVNWNAANDGLATARVSALARADDGMIYAGTYDGDVYRSTNGGGVWEARGTVVSGTQVNCIGFAANGDLFAGTLWDGVYRSDDGGLNWVDASTGLPESWIYAIATSPTGTTFLGNDSGVYRMPDGATEWTAVNADPANYEITGFAFNSAGDVYVSLVINGVIYSTDEGDTWNDIGDGLESSAWSIAINSDDDIFVGSGESIYFRAHDAAEWIMLDTYAGYGQIDGLHIQTDDDIFASRMALHAKNADSDNTFPWGCSLLRSIDNGVSWETFNKGLGYVSCTCMDVYDDLIIAGTFDYGMFRSTDDGANWEEANEGLGGAVVSDVERLDNGDILATMEGRGLYRSTDAGLSWNHNDIGPPYGSTLEYMERLNDDTILVTAYGGIFRSTNGGANWDYFNNGIPEYAMFNDIEITDAGVIFASTGGIGIYRSLDYGVTWEEANNGLTDMEVRTLASNKSGDVYAGTYYDGLFKSTDDGASWVHLATTPISRVDKLAIRHSSGYMYISAYGLDAIYKSTDKGQTWFTETNGEVPETASDFSFNEDGELYAARYGIYKTSFTYVCGDANGDGTFAVGDIVYVISFIFKGGPGPVPVLDSGDANCDGQVNIGDAVYGIARVFKGGPAPCCP